jgi:hypothetical protein
VPISLDVTGLMLEGSRRSDEWQRILEAIPSPQCVPVAVADLLEGEEDDARRAVLELVNDDRTVEEIGLHAHSHDYYVGEILFGKIRDGKLKIVRPRLVHTSTEVASTSAESLLGEAQKLVEDKKLREALRRLRAAGSLEPDNVELMKGVRGLETDIRSQLDVEGIDPAGVPVLESSLEELSSLSFSPEEGFILSRINGVNDVASIVKISPLPEMDSLLVFYMLMEAGHIRLRVE